MKKDICHKYKSWTFYLESLYRAEHKILYGETPLDALVRHYRHTWFGYKSIKFHFYQHEGRISCNVLLNPINSMYSDMHQTWRFPVSFNKKTWKIWEDIEFKI